MGGTGGLRAVAGACGACTRPPHTHTYTHAYAQTWKEQGLPTFYKVNWPHVACVPPARYISCVDLVQGRFNAADFDGYGVTGITVTNVTKYVGGDRDHRD